MRVYVFASAERSPDLVSRAIMRAIDAPYSHVGIICTPSDVFEYEKIAYSNGGLSQATIFHATGEGVNEKNAEAFFEDHTLEFLIDITDYVSRFEYSLGWLESKIGLEYSDSQYLGFIGKIFQRFTSNDQSKFICSEFVAEFLNSCSSIRLFEKLDCDFVSPKEIVEGLRLVQKQKGKI